MVVSDRQAMVIVGAGHAGGRAAFALRDAGWSGAIVLVGDEHEPPYERPPLSKGVLLREPFTATLAPPSRYAEAGIEWLPGRRATRIDRAAGEVLLNDGRRLPYHALLLATGGRARRLDVPGAELEGVCTLRTLADASALATRLTPGARLVVIGGGFIGLEVAASARTRGCSVGLLEAAPRLLGRGLPEPIAAQVQALHTAHGVNVSLGVTPVGFERAGAALRVRLADGGSIEADTVVVGIGIAPNCELAEGAGLVCSDSSGSGIVVDAHLRTADPRIFAAGDVARFTSPASGRSLRLESWHNAEDHARVAAVNMAGGSAMVGTTPWFWSDQYDHQLQIAGDPSLAMQLATRALGDAAQIHFHLDAEGGIAGVSGFGPTGALAKEFKLARMLFEHGVQVDFATLSDPATRLKALLAASRTGA